MNLADLLSRQGITKYNLSKRSGVPYTTLSDICSGKTSLEKCSAGTVYRLAKELHMPMEELLESCIEKRCSFELFKSSVCHRLKRLGDIGFLMETLEKNEIQYYYRRRWCPESFYLLAMVDYISRENDVELCSDYDALRKQKLSEPIYPASVLAMCVVSKSDEPKENALRDAIPEFIRFNIVESDIRNII